MPVGLMGNNAANVLGNNLTLDSNSPWITYVGSWMFEGIGKSESPTSPFLAEREVRLIWHRERRYHDALLLEFDVHYHDARRGLSHFQLDRRGYLSVWSKAIQVSDPSFKPYSGSPVSGTSTSG